MDNKIAMCGLSGKDVIVTSYNKKCPCLNCIECLRGVGKCAWRNTLESNMCMLDDIHDVICQHCIEQKKEY